MNIPISVFQTKRKVGRWCFHNFSYEYINFHLCISDAMFFQRSLNKENGYEYMEIGGYFPSTSTLGKIYNKVEVCNVNIIRSYVCITFLIIK